MEKEMVFNEKKKKRSFLFKLGLGLLVFSLSLYLIPVITPFTPLPIKVKASIITGSIIIAEILFWLGALFVGKEVASKFKSYLNPKNWRRKREGKKYEK
ncbi:transporter suffix domain-containing protein [Bacillus sp. FJAT-49711]|uniref:transporter suffix domain-containing protein n=1 Tax=Bacillus sp. FJAT-49711 TaxID=2833585 RepID=UPI00201637D4|nr:transporter suffix domain-containing protein [Bacillus sp. FJAT-49711]